MVPEAREFNLSLESQYLNISNKSDEANDEEVVIAHCAVNETDDEWSVIHAKFESIIKSLLPQSEFDFQQSDSNLLKVKKYGNYLETYCSAKTSLSTALKELSKVTSQLNGLEIETKSDLVGNNRSEVFKSCKLIGDMTARFPEFEFKEERNVVVCIVCNQEFNYHQDFDLRKAEISSKFSNLKKNLKRHMERQVHLDKVSAQESTDLIRRKEENRNKKVGFTLGKLSYFNYKHKRPDTDYPELVYLLSKFGVDVGDLNHRRDFPRKLLPYVSEAIEEKIKCYLGSTLQSTGYKPPIKIIADKVTWKHRTRQLMGVVTVVPGAEFPIQALYLGVPVVEEGHKGEDIALNIT